MPMIYDNTVRADILKVKESIILANPSAFAGNNKVRRGYLDLLDSKGAELTYFQSSVCVGLLLSDASLKFNKNPSTSRITMQMKASSGPFLLHLNEVLEEYLSPKSILMGGSRGMYEFLTLKCKQFNHLSDLFTEPGQLNYGNVGSKKAINPLIKDFINPVTINKFNKKQKIIEYYKLKT